MKRSIASAVFAGCLLLTAYCSLAPAQVQDRINRGCGGLGGTLVQVLTNANGSIYMITCTGGQVYINGVPITPGGPSGSGTAGTIPLWTPTGTNLGNSILTQTGTSAITLGAGAFNFTQVAAPSLSAANFGKLYFDSTSKLLNGSFNGGAYYPFARTSVTNNTLAMGAADGRLVDSFALQSGNNFTLTTPSGGVTSLLATGGVANLVLNDTAQTVTAGDTTGAGNNVRVQIADGAQLISLTASGRAQVDVNGGTNLITLGDTQGGGNSVTQVIDDPTRQVRFNDNGSQVARIDTQFGNFYARAVISKNGANEGQTWFLNDNGVASGRFNYFGFTDGNALGGTLDTAIMRDAAGVVSVTNGTAATYRDLILRQLTTTANLNCVTLGTDGSGNLTCTVSDVGLKENLAPYTRGLYDLLQLRPSFWNFGKGRYYHEGRRYAGLLAQDVQKAIPEAVDTTGDGHLQINPAAIQAATVNALRELKALIDAQNQRIAQLEAQLNKKK